jgi:hypothetical protein
MILSRLSEAVDVIGIVARWEHNLSRASTRMKSYGQQSGGQGSSICMYCQMNVFLSIRCHVASWPDPMWYGQSHLCEGNWRAETLDLVLCTESQISPAAVARDKQGSITHLRACGNASRKPGCSACRARPHQYRVGETLLRV